MSLPWIHPFTSIIAGPSGSGKSVFVQKFLNNIDTTCDTRFERIIVYYSEWQPLYSQLDKNIEFREGLPQSSDYSNDSRPKLIIIDDLMTESSSGAIVTNIFTKGSHHNNLSCIFITQNLFHQGKGQRDISLNAQYIVLFRNLRDKSQIKHLARQIFPDNPQFLHEAFSDATSKSYGYLLLDLKQDTPENIRYRTCIFTKEDKHQYVYVPRKQIKSCNSRDLIPVVSL